MDKIKYPFNPQLGTEETVLKQTPTTGSLYFTTDTRKIYLDLDAERAKIPMGGNVGLFYGTMRPAVVVDGQTEFEFKMEDIVGNSQRTIPLIPNVNDLILNNDGCFYKVLEISGEGFDTVLNTEKLTIAGTGGGGGSSDGPSVDDGDLTSFKVGAFKVSERAILKGSPCYVRFVVKATNDVGEYITGNVGTYELLVNNIPVTSGSVKGIPSGETSDELENFNESDINTINIEPFLPLGKNIVPILRIYDAEGRQKASRQLSAISVSSVQLTWDYNNATLNEWLSGQKETMPLEWSVSGDGIEKVTYITIGNITKEIGRGTGSEFDYDLNFAEFNMTHGAHTAKMWVEITIGTNTISTDPIYKNIIVAQDDNQNTIISVCLFEKDLQQYNTIAIPIYIYDRNNISGNAKVNLVENGALKDEWTNVPNLGADPKKACWNYTPVTAGDAVLLTVQSGGQEKTVTVTITSVGISIEEKAGYAFKFKANEFASNTNVQNWKIKDDIGLEFSEKFDWINGGLNSEIDPKYGHCQYMAVKAGSTMTIKYPMWRINAPAAGKHFKFIFKATNCRDYDAQVLSCKVDKKVINIDKTVEYFWLTEPVVTLTHAKTAVIRNGAIELLDVSTETLDVNDESSRQKFVNTYVEFEDGIYQCAFPPIDPEDPEKVYNAWYKVSVEDSFNGLLMRAQNASVRTNNETLDAQYCEDTYIELEVEVVKASDKQYIKMWIDGVPCGYTSYSQNDRFQIEDTNITIGSPDCDVYVYLAKLYEFDLSIDEHMKNFYADAPNAEEMVRRFRRNDIMDDNRTNEINMFKLAKANPNCLVHHYTVPAMPTTKKTEKYPCDYAQYQGSDQAKYYADHVMIKVQGTSSEKYVLSAANLDTDFNYTENNNVPSGIKDGTTHEVLTEGWKMDEDAIGINFTCTKVNVASCENINNLVNQEWYNKFQPYKSVWRCKKAGARDTMQFTSGVIFVTDKSEVIDQVTGVGNNVFSDTKVNGVSYAKLPEEDRYPKLYALGQMGNSKNNIHVFHDQDNEFECCVEVADNQMPQQWMVQELAEEDKKDIGESKKIFEFRYPKKAKKAKPHHIEAWNRFVSWMAHSNPQPRYNKFENIDTEEKYKDFSINKKTFQPIDVYVQKEIEGKLQYVQVDGLQSGITTYYTETAHVYGYTELPLDLPVEERTFEPKTFKGFIAKNQIDENKEPYQKDYTPMIQGCTISTYAGVYTHDTYEYRMAKMLKECEDHLIMDSILFHYLFIERHCMIDNVAKNTFWSTEDCQHWNLIKDYDNDTADGNDNQGKFTRTYGMETTDMLNPNAYVFNANQSVWFNFCHGLGPALEHMYQRLENAYVEEDGKQFNVWDPEAYLNYCEKIQSTIPERVWIEDYYRKYFRPNEVYNDNMFNSMIEGGQKKYQRKQYEIYQNLYMNTKYNSTLLSGDRLVFRPTGTDLQGIQIPVEVYSDCYIYSDVGGQRAKARAKRNTTAYLTCPVNDLTNATMYIHPGSNFTKLGSEAPTGQLGHFAPDQMSFAGAKKLREIVYANENSKSYNFGLKDSISFLGTPLLEKAYLCNLEAYEDTLNMSECSSLLYLDAQKSGFKDVIIANGAPVTTIKLNNPTSLTLTNLTELNNFNIANSSRLQTIELSNIDKNIPNLSKTILEDALVHVDPSNSNDYIDYKITDAVWSINNAAEMKKVTEEDQETVYIKTLDKMLDNIYARPVFGPNKIDRLPYSAAFTGSLNIGTNAYSGNNPLQIYNEYITPNKFAGIDMSFEAESAKLYNVVIYDGDGVPFWSKKTIKNTPLNDDFLASGPSGAFDRSKLIKSPTAEYVYELKSIWKVKYINAKGEEETKILTEDIPVGIDKITSDLSIYPTYSESKRKYKISVKLKHPQTNQISTLVEEDEYEYGKGLSDIIPEDLIPYVNSSSLSLYQGYNFKGYSLVEGSSTVVSDNYIVNGNATLWAVFNLEEDIRKIVHPEWFNVEFFTYNQQELDTPPYYGMNGVILSPKYNLGGKITIPAYVEFNGETCPVIALKNFAFTEDTTGRTPSPYHFTHVFMELDKENKLLYMAPRCFVNSPDLQYFDFDNCAVRTIGSQAFQYCTALTNTSFGNQLFFVHDRAFNQCITSPTPTTIRLPSSLTHIRSLSFSILGIPENSTLEIGTRENLSKLIFSSDSQIDMEIHQNEGAKYKTINFYSEYYDSGDETVTQKLQDTVIGALSIV